MKKWLKVLLLCVLVLLLLAAGLYLWQRENINAIVHVLKTDSETIAQELENKRQEHHQAIEESTGNALTVKPITKEQSQDLLDGKVTPEEIKEELGLPTEPPAETALSTQEDIINQCVAELYAYKADVMGYLGGLKQAALAQWRALDKKERTATKKAEISMEGLRQCYAYEAQVDAGVQEILGRYRSKMTDIGGDTKPIDDLWYYYCDEKEAEKSYYIDQYIN